MPRHDRVTEEAIAALVDAFYAKVRRDGALGPVFARSIADDGWPAHLERLRWFWSSVMLRTGRYKGNPFAAHLDVQGISPALFGRWLALFRETCDELMEPDVAREFCIRADRIAESLQAGLFFRPHAEAR